MALWTHAASVEGGDILVINAGGRIRVSVPEGLSGEAARATLADLGIGVGAEAGGESEHRFQIRGPSPVDLPRERFLPPWGFPGNLYQKNLDTDNHYMG